MSNTVTAFKPELWSKRIQYLLEKSLVSRYIANFEEQSTLTVGYRVHRPQMSDLVVNTYTPGSAVSIQDVTATDEYLEVSTTKEISFYVDEIERIQSKYDFANRFIERAAYQLRNDIDGAFLREALNASITFDDGDISTSTGSSGTPLTLTASNVITAFSKLSAKMYANQIEDDRPWYAVVDPFTVAVMEQAGVFNGFNKADYILANGFMGTDFVGEFMKFRIYRSQNVLHSTVLTYTGQPSADETVTVNGVVFTWKASAAAAGEVTIGADADASYTNLQNAINNSGTGFVALSTANLNILKGVRASATVNTTANTLTVYTNGYAAVSEATSNVTIGSTIANNFIGRMGATDMVLQRDVSVQQNKVQDKTGYNYISYTLYGIKTFLEGRNRSVDFKTLANAF